MPKPKGGTRTLNIPTMRDRIVERAVVDTITFDVELVQSACSFAYRGGIGRDDAIHLITTMRDEGLPHALGTGLWGLLRPRQYRRCARPTARRAQRARFPRAPPPHRAPAPLNWEQEGPHARNPPGLQPLAPHRQPRPHRRGQRDVRRGVRVRAFRRRHRRVRRLPCASRRGARPPVRNTQPTWFHTQRGENSRDHFRRRILLPRRQFQRAEPQNRPASRHQRQP